MTTKLHFLPLLALILISGCASRVDYGPRHSTAPLPRSLMVVPFENATDDVHAGRAATDLVATALKERGVSVVQLPVLPPNELGETPRYSEADIAAAAKKAGAGAIVRGTALEYRYKTDLDGDPAAGLAVEIFSQPGGELLWRATGSNAGIGYTSLTATAQRVAADVVARMPF